MELVVTAAVISAEVWVFRWVVERMPVLGGEPEWARHHDEPAGPRLWSRRRAPFRN